MGRTYEKSVPRIPWAPPLLCSPLSLRCLICLASCACSRLKISAGQQAFRQVAVGAGRTFPLVRLGVVHCFGGSGESK